MAKVNRESFLRSLESILPGTSPREVVEQSNTFVFRDGQVMSFNDEIACRTPISGLPKSIVGAVPALKLLEILTKFPEDEIGIEGRAEELVINGKGRKTGIRMEAEVLLPIDSIEQPEEWKPVNENFCEALGLVGRCAGSDESRFVTVCVHIHPKWVEAFDDYHLCRWLLDTGITEATLIRQTSAKALTKSGITEIAETPAWLHFRSPSKLVISCRRYVEDFPDLSKILKADPGQPIQLPKGLADATDKAKVFSTENENDEVLVELKGERLRIKGQGLSGWYSEVKKLNYTGPPFSFLVAPDMLAQLVKNYSECLIAPGRLRVNAAEYTYITCLSQPEGAATPAGAAQED